MKHAAELEARGVLSFDRVRAAEHELCRASKIALGHWPRAKTPLPDGQWMHYLTTLALDAFTPVVVVFSLTADDRTVRMHDIYDMSHIVER